MDTTPTSPWMPLFLLIPLFVITMFRICHEETLREAAERALTAEKIYSKWLRDRLAEQQRPDDTAPIQHILVPKGPAEEV